MYICKLYSYTGQLRAYRDTLVSRPSCSSVTLVSYTHTETHWSVDLAVHPQLHWSVMDVQKDTLVRVYQQLPVIKSMPYVKF